MIPKIIHYCWFGRGPKPELAIACIESWAKRCPNYTLVEWNEDNFDINSNLYVKQAYAARKYAFVTDYVRLYAMYHQGGLYMDTDVMVLKSPDEFLDNRAFSGFESKEKVSTGVLASEQGCPIIGELLEYYNDRTFLKPDGSLDLTTNVETITNMLKPHGLIPNGEYQVIDGFALYSQNTFCPDLKRLKDKEYMKDIYTIHYFAGSWKSEKDRKREGSLWWKMMAVPGTFVSKCMKEIYGDKWILWKNKIRDKFLYGSFK